jgi:hypothetical protein
MFNSTGYSLADIAAATGGNGNNDGWGGDGAWWIILLFLFVNGGYGNRGGFGFGGGGGGGYGVPPATQEDVRSAVDQQTLLSKLDQQTYGLADGVYALNSAITTGFHGVDNAICTLGYQNQQGFNTLANQMANCCCETQRLIERGFADTNYNLATQACDTRRAIADSTRDIIDSQNSGTRAILDFLTQDKIAALTAENQTLKFAASQANQNMALGAMMDANTAEILRRVAPTPVPAYPVYPPYQTIPYGCGTGFNTGCGCC